MISNNTNRSKRSRVRSRQVKKASLAALMLLTAADHTIAQVTPATAGKKAVPTQNAPPAGGKAPAGTPGASSTVTPAPSDLAPIGGEQGTAPAAPDALPAPPAIPGASPTQSAISTPSATQPQNAVPLTILASGTTPPLDPRIGTGAQQSTTGTPAASVARVLNINQALTLALGNNSTIILAQQRLQKANEYINQLNAQEKPQFSSSVVDTLSSEKGFGTSGGAVATPSIPGGGAIPTITDEGGGTTGGFTGGGGGGSPTGSTSTSTSLGSGTSTTGTTSSTTNPGLITTTTGGGTTSGGGTSGGTTGTTGNTGTTGTTGTSSTTGTTGSAISGGVTAQALMAGLPPIMQKYASAQGFKAVPRSAGRVAAAQPRATGTGTTGTTGTSGTTTAGNPANFSGSSGSYNNYSGRVDLTYIPEFADISGGLAAERSVVNRTRAYYIDDLQRLLNETALSVKNDYFTTLYDQAIVDVDQEQVNDAAEDVRITQAQFTNGTAAQYDVLTAQVTLTNDQEALSQARSALRIEVGDLNNLLGLAPNTVLQLQSPTLPPLNETYDPTQNQQIALRQRPELIEADNNVAIAGALVKLNRSALLPTLGFTGDGAYNGNVSSGSPHSTLSLSAVLDIPLDDGGLTRSEVRSAQVDLQTQITTRAQLQQNVILEVQQALNNINDGQTRTAASGFGVTQAREALRLAQVRYENGLGTQLDITNAQANLATAEENLLSAQFAYQTAVAQLVRGVGSR